MLKSNRSSSKGSKIFPPAVKSGYGRLVNWVCRIGGAPLYWSNDQLYMVKKRSKWYITSSILSMYFLYIIIQITYSVITKRKLQEYNLLLFVILAFLGVALFYLLMMLRAFDMILVVNSAIQFIEWFHAKYAKKHENTNTRVAVVLIAWLMRMLRAGIKLIAFGGGIMCMVQPFVVISPLHIIPEDYKSNWLGVVLGIPLGILASWSILCLGGTALVSAFSAILAWIGYYQCENQLVLKNGHYWTIPWLRTPINLRKTLFAIKILITLLHNTYQDFAMYIQMLLTRSVHLCCFLVIRHHHEMTAYESFIYVGMSLAYVFGWLAVMQCSAVLHTTSVKMISSWRNCTVSNQRERVIWKKTRRAMKPVGFKVGNLYVVKPMTVILICESYITGTIRLLLTFRKQENKF